MRTFLITIGFFLLCLPLFGQGEGNWWFFGDSVLINFNSSPPTVYQNANLRAYSEGAAFSTSGGNLICYHGGTQIRDASLQRMENGGGIRTGSGAGPLAVTQGCLILNLDTTIYVFSLSRNLGGAILSYSLVFPSGNGGLGTVGQKNIILDSALTDKLVATRHADGESWWIVTHKVDNNTYVKFLLDQTGLSGPFYQDIGQNHLRDVGYIGESAFSPDGSKYAVTDYLGMIDYLEFDRCSGEFSNHVPISVSTPVGFHGVCFSNDSQLLYAIDNTKDGQSIGRSHLYQYDLNAPNIPASRITVWGSGSSAISPDQDLSGIEAGPDGNIYTLHSYYDTRFQPSWYASHMGVVHNPDGRGTACDFRPESFPLAPGRGKAGLPNMPNFRLGKLVAQEADAGPDQTICHEGFAPEGQPNTIPSYGEGIQIGTPDTSGGKCTFSWFPEDGLSDPNSPQPFAVPEQTTTYYLTVTDTTINPDCATTEDTVTVTVEYCKVPNVVTPNGDGQNDTFILDYLPEGTEVSIYDRWGRLVFDSKNYQNEWPSLNGPALNHRVAPTTYFYVLKYPDRDEYLRGWVTLVY